MNREELIDIAWKIRDGSMEMTDLPFSEIVSFITTNYRRYQGEDSTLYEKLYSDVIIEGLKNNNRIIISDVLLLLSNSCIIMTTLQSDIDSYIESADYWWNKASESLIQATYYSNELKKNKWYSANERVNNYTYFRGRGVVYSVITGDYDAIHIPLCKEKEYDYILFTNNRKITSDFWKVIYIDNSDDEDDAMLSRRIKILGHRLVYEYDYSIYIDGKILIKGPITELIRKYSKTEPMLCFPHPTWQDIRREANRVIELKKADNLVIEEQIKDYYSEGYKDECVLIEACILIRDHHNDQLKIVMHEWWNQLNKYTYRDQISFPYVCWKNDFVIDLCCEKIYDNEWFDTVDHL